jgi:CHASE3 domain sensor protein
MEVATVSWTDERLDDLNDKVDAFRAETGDELKTMRAEMTDEFKAIRADMANEFKAVRGEMRDAAESLAAQMNTRLDSVHKSITATSTTLVSAIIGGFIAVLVTMVVAQT